MVSKYLPYISFPRKISSLQFFTSNNLICKAETTHAAADKIRFQNFAENFQFKIKFLATRIYLHFIYNVTIISPELIRYASIENFNLHLNVSRE